MNRKLSNGLAAGLAATMALAGAGPALADHSPSHQDPTITGNPPKTTVVHCERLDPGARGVIIIQVHEGVVRVRNNCPGLPPDLLAEVLRRYAGFPGGDD